MGLEAIEGAIRFAEEAGVCFWNAELLRLKGHCWRACRHAQKWRFLTGKLWPWCDISRPGRLSCALLSASPASALVNQRARTGIALHLAARNIWLSFERRR
jgi:hypothetical protein